MFLDKKELQMKEKFNLKVFKSYLTTFVTVLLFSLNFSWIGCSGSGGGTSGTGGGGFGVSGVLRTKNNVPVQGVQVSVVTASGGQIVKVSYVAGPVLDKESQQAFTDSQGQFNFSLDKRPDSLGFTFMGDNFDSTLEILSIPSVATNLNLKLLIDSETSEISEELEQFEDDEGNEVERD